MKVCCKCKNSETRTQIQRRPRKDGSIGITRFEQWYSDESGRPMCKSCYDHYINGPKWNPIYESRRFLYKDRQILASEPQKIGICNFCRAVVGQINTQLDSLCKRTHMAHMEYHDDAPEKDRLELCVPCHNRHDKTKYNSQ